MAKKTYCGELIGPSGEFVGCIHRSTGGFVVRVPTGHSIGSVIFEGREFKQAEFEHVKTINLGYAMLAQYRLKESA